MYILQEPRSDCSKEAGYSGCVLLANLSNPIVLRKARIVYNFGLSECNRVKAMHGRTNELFYGVWVQLHVVCHFFKRGTTVSSLFLPFE